jgi:phosphatidylethanolamine-binding protein (PEBP) family uncharacterized protein
MVALDYVELFLAKLLSGVRGHECARFIKGPAFASLPDPTITVTSSDCGPSGSNMSIDHTQDGKDLFPQLSWTSVPETQEYLLIVQDVDAPMPSPIAHGIFHSIPPEKTSVSNEDFEPVKGTRKNPEGTQLSGGFQRGANLRGWVYGGPRALKGHGPHRYYYMVVALKEKLDSSKMSPIAKKAELAKGIEGKVLGWGEWMGVSERKWA